ncbi:MAG TPA: ABC transporter permease [Mycobacteriales bacterium]|nr:ABC transporter permease [Mycobacteriales bacterium]
MTATGTEPAAGPAAAPAAAAGPAVRPGAARRRVVTGGALAAFGVLAVVGFGLGTHAGLHARFRLAESGAKVGVPDLVVPARISAVVLGGVCVLIGLARVWRGWRGLGDRSDRAGQSDRSGRWTVAGIACLVAAFLCWAVAGESVSLVGIAQGTLFLSLPLVFGSLSGVLCERSGVINVSIEGQFLFGAFTAAFAGSLAGSLWVGLLAGGIAGMLLGAVLAVFSIRYLVDQVILGVVLNVFALGLTGFLYDRLLQPNADTYNNPGVFAPIRIPVLADIPIAGPVLFDSNVFLYLAYLLLVVLQVGLFHTRWGLRVRAVGEHPQAADTVGIRVLATRYRNVIMGGFVAGIGGAFFTVGSVGGFTKNMTSGKGFIALAALIFGRWSPLGAMAAALLFGFADQLQLVLSGIGTPIPSQALASAPYLATIFAVAGLVGKVTAPKADGKPYVKQ